MISPGFALPSGSWRRLWPAASPSHLLPSAAALPRQRQCLFEAQLLAPPASFLWDHSVHGRPLLPGSALLEMALAAAHSLATPPTQPAASVTLMLADCAIPAPLALSASPSAMQLQVEVGLRAGSFVVRGLRSKSTHLSGRVSRFLQRTDAGCTAVCEGTQRLTEAAAQLPAALLVPWGQRAFQTATLAVDPKLHTEGYRSHPAVVDSSLHLGATLTQPTLPGVGSIHVPVAVEAFASNQEFNPHLAELATQCRLESRPASGAAGIVSTYTVHHSSAGASAAAAINISGLEARSIKLPAASKTMPLFPAIAAAASSASGTAVSLQHQQQHAAGAAAEPLLLYQVQWEVERQAGQYSSERSLLHLRTSSIAMTVKRGSNIAQQLAIPTAGSGEVQPLARLLAHLQNGIRGGTAGSRVRLATHAAMPPDTVSLEAPVVNLAAAAAWGMLRVAASEAPDAKWSAVDLDSQATGSHLAAGEAENVSGSLVRHGLLLHPMLLPSASDGAAAVSPEQPSALQGKVLVTGGMGGEATQFLQATFLSQTSCLASLTAHSSYPHCRHRHAPGLLAGTAARGPPGAAGPVRLLQRHP